MQNARMTKQPLGAQENFSFGQLRRIDARFSVRSVVGLVQNRKHVVRRLRDAVEIRRQTREKRKQFTEVEDKVRLALIKTLKLQPPAVSPGFPYA
jgi:hypothetical protein